MAEDKKTPSKLAQAIRLLRQHVGKSQAEFAEMMGVDQSTVSRWERGEVTPALHHMIAIKRLGARTKFNCPLPSLGELIDFPAEHYVNRLRSISGLPEEQFAELAGVELTQLRQWQNGDATPTLEALTTMIETLSHESSSLPSRARAEISDIVAEWSDVGLFPRSAKPRGQGQAGIPIIGLEHAGAWSGGNLIPLDEFNEYVWTAVAHSRLSFAVRLKCDSMAPKYELGSIIICDPAEAPIPGECVIAKLDRQDRAIFRRYQVVEQDAYGNRKVRLSPLNDDWPVEMITPYNPGRIVAPMIEARIFPRRTNL